VESDSLPAETPVSAPEPNWALAGEALAAVTGLFQDKPITPDQGAKAEGLMADLQRDVAKFCKFKPFEAFKMPRTVDFEETYGRLTALTETEIAIATQDLTSPELIEAWTQAVNSARAYARAGWPAQIRQTPTGPDWLEPSKTDGGRATAELVVLENPLLLVTEMTRGTLTPSQVVAVKTARPEMFSRIVTAMEMALNAAGAVGRQCPWSHESQLRQLFGLPPVGLVTFKNADAMAQPKTGDFSIDFEGLKTKGQTVR
jgi:hypothetical protein